MKDRIFDRMAGKVLSAIRYFFPETYSRDVMDNSGNYKWALGRATTLGNKVGEVEGELQKTKDDLTRRKESYDLVSESLVGRGTRDRKRIERLKAENEALVELNNGYGRYVLERIGFVRRQDELTKRVGVLESVKTGLEREQRRIFRATYCLGDYKTKPVILADKNGGIFFQNRAATNLLKDRLVGADLPGVVDLHNKKLQIVRIGGECYSLVLKKIINKYEISLGKAPKFYRTSKTPHLLNLPEIILHKKPQTT